MAKTTRNTGARPEALLATQQDHLDALHEGLENVRTRLESLQDDLRSLLAHAAELATGQEALREQLGTRASEPTPERTPESAPAPTVAAAARGAREVTLSGPRGANARGVFGKEGLTVLRGSEIADPMVPSMPAPLRALRQQLLDERVVVRARNRLTFAHDHVFSSPSAAAAVVMGRNANGWREWRDKRGRTLEDAKRR
ncbi:MAG: DUF4357 domain-containing protein [Myxococcota bacterium]